jgi:hypothetical protein
VDKFSLPKLTQKVRIMEEDEKGMIILRCCQYPDHKTSTRMMIIKWSIGKNSEESGCGLKGYCFGIRLWHWWKSWKM